MIIITMIVLTWDISISNKIWNFGGAVLEIFIDHKFQWPQKGLNYELLYTMHLPNPLGHKAVT